MLWRFMLLAALLASVFLFPAPRADAQGPPPSGRPSQAQGAPGGPQAPTHLPPEIRDAPYNGPSTKAPAGIATPHNQQEATQLAQQLAGNPALVAAYQASRATRAARQDLSQRLRAGQLPAEADKALGRGYPVDPPRRSDDPTGLLKLLTVNAEPAAEPDAQGPYFAGFLCFAWENFYQDRDQWGDDLFGAQGLNYCFPPATNEAVTYMHVSLDIYKCSWYIITWDICGGPFHWYEMWPSCEAALVTYLWCGGGGQRPRAYYPEGISGAYFLRVSTNTQTIYGGNAGTYVDSEVLPYRCFQGGGVWC